MKQRKAKKPRQGEHEEEHQQEQEHLKSHTILTI
jgi:hypothetical protein